MRSAALRVGMLCGLCLCGGRALACSPAQVAELEAALQAAPAVGGEHRCEGPQARRALALLNACRPTPAQAVVYLGAGRCFQQAGLSRDAARAYRAYLAGDDTAVSAERAAERRQRAGRWLRELGEPDPPTATLVLHSNLRGARVDHLGGRPETLLLDRGDNRLPQPPGARRLSLSLRGFERVDLDVDLHDGETTRAEVDWRAHLQPRYAGLLGRWDDYERRNLTPAGYMDRRQRPVSAVLGLLVAGAGAALLAVCATNANGACDAGWQQGLAYGFGSLFALSGTVGLVGSLAAPYEALPAPSPSLSRPPGAAPPAPARPFY